MTECNGCGSCCNPVVLGASQAEYAGKLPAELDGGAADRDWVLHDLTEIHPREGIARSSHIDRAIQFGWCGEEEVMLVLHFYECRHYDAAARRCGNYDGRPPICRGYPWYGQPPDKARGLPLECEFQRDLGEVPIQLVTRPVGPSLPATP